jgi:uncharacterized protein (TIGR03086 family)
MEIIEQHRRATAAVEPVLARARAVDLGLPTPCAGWDLRALLEHMAGQDAGFAAAVRAGESDVDASAFVPCPLGPEPFATLTEAAADLDAAFAEAGTEAGTESGRTVWLAEFGRRFPLADVAGFHLLDVLVHGWDVAATLGVAVDYDEDLVMATLAQAERVPTGPFREDPRSPFAPARADGGTDPWDRTLALLGRDPLWTPASA